MTPQRPIRPAGAGRIGRQANAPAAAPKQTRCRRAADTRRRPRAPLTHRAKDPLTPRALATPRGRTTRVRPRRRHSASRMAGIMMARATGSLLLALAAVLAAIGPLLAPPRNDAAVVFAPWVTRADAFVRTLDAGATVRALGGTDFVMIITTPTPAVRRALRRRGGWFVTDAAAVAGCWRRPGRAVERAAPPPDAPPHAASASLWRTG